MKPETYDFLKILASVFLGMFGKALFDCIKEEREIFRDKEYIIDYLKNAKKIFPILKNDYEKAKDRILNHQSLVYEFKQFEAFNTEILKSLSFPRYYRIFNTKSSMIFEIYHVVNALQKHLPILIFSEYNDAINAIAIKSDILEQEELDRLVKLRRDTAVAVIDMKITEIIYLEKRINLFLNK